MQLNWDGAGRAFDGFDACLDRLTRARGFGLAVSGGPDSTAMLALFVHWRHRRNDKRSAIVFSVDHGLRAESAHEAEQVADLASSLGLGAQVLRWQPGRVHSGLQEKARAARYQLLGAACAQAGLDHLLLGHTADDQAETLLMRLMRGSGVDGLSAMAEVRQADHGLALVRPLLGVRKADIIALLGQSGLACTHDPSNENPAFLRVWTRRMLAELGQKEPEVVARLAATAARMARASAALERMTSESLSTILAVNGAAEATMGQGAFFALDEEIRLRILRRFITRLASAYPPEEGQLLKLEAALQAGEPGQTLAGLRFGIDGPHIRITREYGRTPPAPIVPEEGMTWDSRFRISGTPAEAGLQVEMLGPRWPDARERLGLEGPAGLGTAALAALPCLVREGQIMGLPYFGSGLGLSFTPVVRERLLGDALTKQAE